MWFDILWLPTNDNLWSFGWYFACILLYFDWMECLNRWYGHFVGTKIVGHKSDVAIVRKNDIVLSLKFPDKFQCVTILDNWKFSDKVQGLSWQRLVNNMRSFLDDQIITITFPDDASQKIKLFLTKISIVVRKTICRRCIGDQSSLTMLVSRKLFLTKRVPFLDKNCCH